MTRSPEERLASAEARLNNIDEALRNGRERFDSLRADIAGIRLEMASKADIEALAAEIRGAKNTMRDWRTGGAVVVLIGGIFMAVIAQSEKFAAFFRKLMS